MERFIILEGNSAPPVGVPTNGSWDGLELIDCWWGHQQWERKYEIIELMVGYQHWDCPEGAKRK